MINPNSDGTEDNDFVVIELCLLKSDLQLAKYLSNKKVCSESELNTLGTILLEGLRCSDDNERGSWI